MWNAECTLQGRFSVTGTVSGSGYAWRVRSSPHSPHRASCSATNWGLFLLLAQTVIQLYSVCTLMATINFNKLEIKTLLLVEMSKCPVKSCNGMVWLYSSLRATMQSCCTPASTVLPPYISRDTARTAAIPGDAQGEAQRMRATAAGTQRRCPPWAPHSLHLHNCRAQAKLLKSEHGAVFLQLHFLSAWAPAKKQNFIPQALQMRKLRRRLKWLIQNP